MLVTRVQPGEHSCERKEKSLASLNLARDALSKVRVLYPHCGNNRTSANETHCGIKEKSLGYLDVALNLIDDAVDNFPNCSGHELIKGNETAKTKNQTLFGRNQIAKEENKTIKKENKILKFEHPIDCSQVLENGYNVSGVYPIWLEQGSSVSSPVKVFCDMETDRGGWTVIQRRGDYLQQENFYRDWADYKRGFGNITKDFWLGNDNIFALANQSSYTIRFDLVDADGAKGYATYSYFKLGDESSKYLLHISGYSGNIGDSMKGHNNKKFSTKDNGNDDSSDGNYCTSKWKGGWWYAYCYDANLNGAYRKGAKKDSSTVNWIGWRGNNNLNAVEIKIRPNGNIRDLKDIEPTKK